MILNFCSVNIPEIQFKGKDKIGVWRSKWPFLYFMVLFLTRKSTIIVIPPRSKNRTIRGFFKRFLNPNWPHVVNFWTGVPFHLSVVHLFSFHCTVLYNILLKNLIFLIMFFKLEKKILWWSWFFSSLILIFLPEVAWEIHL